MRVFVVFLLSLPVMFAVSDEEDLFLSDDEVVEDTLLTLSVEQVEAVSVMFAAICAEGGGPQFSSEQVFPYLHTFVQQCERLVLERGSFPHDVSARIFDDTFATAVGASDSDSGFYSQFAVYFLQSVWRNALALDRKSLLEYEVYGTEESFDLIFAFSERIYVLSAILSALGNDEPHDAFSARLGVRTDLLFPERKEGVIVISEQQRGVSVEQRQILQPAVAKEEIDPYVFAYFGSVFPVLFCVNFFAVVIVLFTTRRQR